MTELLHQRSLRRMAGTAVLALVLAVSTLGFSAGSWAQTPKKVERVLLKTSMGDILLELDGEKAPLSVANFLQYVKDGHYKDTIFHRVIKDFMAQGGGMDAQMNEKPTRAPIKLESRNGLLHKRYAVAMARTMIPDSGTAQFFINFKDNEFLNAAPGNPGYAVFGKVIQGQKVVDAIAAVPTGSKGPHQDVPIKPILIQDAVWVTQ